MGLSRQPAKRPPRNSSRKPAVPGLAARLAAARLLGDVLDRGQPLDARIDAADSPLVGLEPQDRALARAIVGTALRRHGQIGDALGRLIERDLPRRAGSLPRLLEIAATQILFMEVPDHAAVSVALAAADQDGQARHFKPLANGVLRSMIRQRDAILADQDAVRLNMPDWLWNRLVGAYGEAETRRIGEAQGFEAPLDITAIADPETWATELGGALLETGTIRTDAAGRIEQRPGYEAGAWWVQDAAAALPVHLLGDVAGKSVLDLCAAPGGKTAQLAAAGAKVTAVDVSRNRVARLKANLARLGLEAECVTADALKYDPGRTFDAVLVDAPCTATGTIRRHPDIPWLKGEADVTTLAAIQAKLLQHATKLVGPGGVLVFATCSLLAEEGDDLVRQPPAGLTPFPIEAGAFPGLSAEWLRSGSLRTLPFHQPGGAEGGGMDGFFAARFRRV